LPHSVLQKALGALAAADGLASLVHRAIRSLRSRRRWPGYPRSLALARIGPAQRLPAGASAPRPFSPPRFDCVAC
jgi:2-polyprenyl-6-methoxyphenol hydroxylase-like FAD-dependent oxidoreductase